MHSQGIMLEPDYILYLLGLAFFILAAVALALRRIPTPYLSWVSLAGFGFLFGCYQWVECAALTLGNPWGVRLTLSILFAGAAICLFLFSATKFISRWVTHPWLRTGINAVLLAVLIAGIHMGGNKDYELAVFFFLAATATCYACLDKGSGKVAAVMRKPLWAVAAVLTVLALAFMVGTPKDNFFPPSILNRETFTDMTGLSITSIYIVAVLGLARALWQTYQCADQAATLDVLARRTSWFGVLLPAVMLLLAAGGWVWARHMGCRAGETCRGNLMDRAVMVAAALDRETVSRLTGTAADLNLPDFPSLQQSLTRIEQASPDVRNLYLFGAADGKRIHYSTSSVPGRRGEPTAASSAAETLSPEEREFFRTGQAYVTKPYQGHLGDWVSAVVGMVPDGHGSNRIRVALGMDVRASDIAHQITKARFLGLFQMALLSVIVLGVLLFRQHWWDRTRQIELNQAVVMELSRHDFGSLQEALSYTAQTLAGALNVERISIWRCLDDRSAILCEESYTQLGTRHQSGALLPVANYPRYFQALEAGTYLHALDVRQDERVHELVADYLRPHNILSLLDAPIRREGKMQGVLCIEHVGTIRNWSSEEIQLVLAIVDMVALQMEKNERLTMQRKKEESEERYRRVFEHSPEAIMVLDSHNRLVELNCRALMIIGYPMEDLRGQDIADWPCFDPISRDRVREQMNWLSVRGREPAKPRELGLVTRSGERHEGLFDAALLQGAGGRVMGKLVIIADITQNKRTEEALKGTLNELERHNRLMRGREARILELKQDVNRLLGELGRSPAYPSALALEGASRPGAASAPREES